MSNSTYNPYTEDDGTTHVCANCNKRWGGPIYGERTLTISRCPDNPKCQKTLSSREVASFGWSTGNYKRTYGKTVGY